MKAVVQETELHMLSVANCAEGKVLKQHLSFEQVFQPVFTADGKSVAYGVKDGNKLNWKAEQMGE